MATGFNGLDDTNPADNGFIGDGAAEIRSVKNALITTFPNVAGEITKPTNYGPVSGSTQPTEADFSQLFTDMQAIVSPDTTNSPVIPQGMVTMWSGNTADSAAITALNDKGWFLCVGGSAPNGFSIPNLQNRFIKGWGDATVGSTSGGGTIGTLRTSTPYNVGTTTDKSVTKGVTLTEANLPEHTHFTVKSENIDTTNSLTSSTAIRLEWSPGTSDQDYFLQGASGGTADVGKTSGYGNPSPSQVDTGLSVADFAHEHEIEVSGDLEPSHYVLAYIVYAGVV